MSLKDYSKKELIEEYLRLYDDFQEHAHQISVIGEMLCVRWDSLEDTQKIKDKIRLLQNSAEKKAV